MGGLAEKIQKAPNPHAIHGSFNVVEQIKKMMSGFTPRQRMLAEYILQNPESVAFLSISELSERAGVSLATIVRFCHLLGYEGYAHWNREAQQSIQYELSTTGRFQLVHSLKGRVVGNHPSSAFERVVASEIDNVIGLTQSIQNAEFYRCIKMMAEADQICIIGCMASSCLANFFGYNLRKIFPRVEVVDHPGGRAAGALKSLSSRSLVFLICFPRYPRFTLELGQVSKQKGAKIIAITNSHISPVVPLATLSFLIPLGILSFVDAYAAPMTFIHALVTEFSESHPKIARVALRQFDDYVLQTDLFLKSDNWGEKKNSRTRKLMARPKNTNS